MRYLVLEDEGVWPTDLAAPRLWTSCEVCRHCWQLQCGIVPGKELRLRRLQRAQGGTAVERGQVVEDMEDLRNPRQGSVRAQEMRARAWEVGASVSDTRETCVRVAAANDLEIAVVRFLTAEERPGSLL